MARQNVGSEAAAAMGRIEVRLRQNRRVRSGPLPLRSFAACTGGRPLKVSQSLLQRQFIEMRRKPKVQRIPHVPAPSAVRFPVSFIRIMFTHLIAHATQMTSREPRLTTEAL
jgi:hypothetical protein